MKWYDDIKEELVIAILGATAVISLWQAKNDIAILAIGILGTYLKREKKDNGISKPSA